MYKSKSTAIFAKISIICCSILLISCQQQSVQQFEGSIFGTVYHISYVGEYDSRLPKQVDSVMNTINTTFSIFDTTSLIFRINQGENIKPNEDFLKILNLSLRVNQETQGAFECTIQPLIELWGFGRENQKKVVAQAQIDSVKQFVGSEHIHIQGDQIIKKDSRTQFNFNAIAKGYAVDKVAQFLKKSGHENCLVEIGGEIVALGSKNGKAWRIGIQTPTETADGAIDSDESFELQNRAVATSGNYRNFFEQDGQRYTHILNPVTGKPETTKLLSVTVIAPDCATADAYATAFMVLGLDKSSAIVKQHAELEAWFIHSENGKLKTTKVTK
ncbi:MAG: FAD:protein FMN transferase [Bacteroidales bacterium]|nr:FAD:protein FMN transferase [Bacteroidales bacterium]